MERIFRYRGNNMLIQNLDESIDSNRLRREFAPFGRILTAEVMMDDESKSKGYGFICYNSSEEATRAVAEMDGRVLGTKAISCKISETSDDRDAYLSSLHVKLSEQKGLYRQPACAKGYMPTLRVCGPGNTSEIKSPRWITQTFPAEDEAGPSFANVGLRKHVAGSADIKVYPVYDDSPNDEDEASGKPVEVPSAEQNVNEQSPENVGAIGTDITSQTWESFAEGDHPLCLPSSKLAIDANSSPQGDAASNQPIEVTSTEPFLPEHFAKGDAAKSSQERENQRWFTGPFSAETPAVTPRRNIRSRRRASILTDIREASVDNEPSSTCLADPVRTPTTGVSAAERSAKKSTSEAENEMWFTGPFPIETQDVVPRSNIPDCPVDNKPPHTFSYEGGALADQVKKVSTGLSVAEPTTKDIRSETKNQWWVTGPLPVRDIKKSNESPEGEQVNLLPVNLSPAEIENQTWFTGPSPTQDQTKAENVGLPRHASDVADTKVSPIDTTEKYKDLQYVPERGQVDEVRPGPFLVECSFEEQFWLKGATENEMWFSGTHPGPDQAARPIKKSSSENQNIKTQEWFPELYPLEDQAIALCSVQGSTSDSSEELPEDPSSSFVVPLTVSALAEHTARDDPIRRSMANTSKWIAETFPMAIEPVASCSKTDPSDAEGAAGPVYPTGSPEGNVKQNKITLTGSSSFEIAPLSQRQILGEQIFYKIQPLCDVLAGKITGMILDLNPETIFELLHDYDRLKKAVYEAMKRLEAANYSHSPTKESEKE